MFVLQMTEKDILATTKKRGGIKMNQNICEIRKKKKKRSLEDGISPLSK